MNYVPAIYLVCLTLAVVVVCMAAVAAGLWLEDRKAARRGARPVIRTVRARLWCTAECTDPHRADAVLVWEPAAPWTVRLFVTAPETPDEAVLSRELLRDGLLFGSGVGAVRVGPGRIDRQRLVVFAFEAQHGPVRVAVPRRKAAGFLKASLRACPWNTEPALLDLDAVIERLVRADQ